MKKYMLPVIFLVVFSGVHAQVTLTYRNNGLLAGDSARTRTIAWVDPGAPGENRFWDFSGIRFTGKAAWYGVKEELSPMPTVNGDRKLTLSEDGYSYSLLYGENGYSETGYTNTSKKMTMLLSDAIVMMQYPLSFGQKFSNPFTGVAWYNETSRIDISGDYTVTADAFGTLIFPDRILKNVLRIKAVKRSLQIGVCGSIQSNNTKYYWFAPGYRYPVLMIAASENRYGANEPVVIKNAWVNLDQPQQGSGAGSTNTSAQTASAANSVVVYPNPFTEKVSYNYYLWKPMTVTVELYDMSGKMILLPEKKRLQEEGLHSGTVNAEILALPPGIYYLRFTLDREVVVSKIVKI